MAPTRQMRKDAGVIVPLQWNRTATREECSAILGRGIAHGGADIQITRLLRLASYLSLLTYVQHGCLSSQLDWGPAD